MHFTHIIDYNKDKQHAEKLNKTFGTIIALSVVGTNDPSYISDIAINQLISQLSFSWLNMPLTQ